MLHLIGTIIANNSSVKQRAAVIVGSVAICGGLLIAQLIPTTTYIHRKYPAANSNAPGHTIVYIYDYGWPRRFVTRTKPAIDGPEWQCYWREAAIDATTNIVIAVSTVACFLSIRRQTKLKTILLVIAAISCALASHKAIHNSVSRSVMLLVLPGVACVFFVILSLGCSIVERLMRSHTVQK